MKRKPYITGTERIALEAEGKKIMEDGSIVDRPKSKQTLGGNREARTEAQKGFKGRGWYKEHGYKYYKPKDLNGN